MSNRHAVVYQIVINCGKPGVIHNYRNMLSTPCGQRARAKFSDVKPTRHLSKKFLRDERDDGKQRNYAHDERKQRARLSRVVGDRRDVSCPSAIGRVNTARLIETVKVKRVISSC
jgi:hypothetical protein